LLFLAHQRSFRASQRCFLGQAVWWLPRVIQSGGQRLNRQGREERNPSLKNIAAIAEALGVALSELFSLRDQK
jgi:hypothetical protein